MPGKMSFAEEVAENRLVNERRVMGAYGPGCREDLDHVGGDHQIAKSQGREQGVGETAGKDYHSCPVQAFERRDRPAAIAVFAVIVILKDEASRSARPLEQR